MNLVSKEILDENGNIEAIKFTDAEGFSIDAVWDDSDEHTEENREKFREWAHRFVSQLIEKENSK
jgi:hypothetical protein